MLILPNEGIHRSVTRHRCDLPVFCDWLESTVLFDESEVSQSDVVDFLFEQQIYDGNNPDFCMEFVTSAWRELRRRLRWIGRGSPLKVKDQRILRRREWDRVPAHAFCLVLGLAPFYEDWAAQFGPDYTQQGELFEKLVVASAGKVFLRWDFARTGWSRDNTSKLCDVVCMLAEAVSEDVGNLEKYAGEAAKEAGLDVFWHKRFADERGGHPVYLAQCASGANWCNKLHTPEMSVWQKLVDWKLPPNRAFAIPFALSDDEFVRRCNQFNGLLLDRYRILMAAARAAWPPHELADEIRTWVRPRVQWLLGLGRG
jgi:hypothetical protein